MIFQTDDWRQKVEKATVEERVKIFSAQNIQEFIRMHREEICLSPEQRAGNARQLEEAKQFKNEVITDIEKWDQKVILCRQEIQKKVSEKFDLLKDISTTTEQHMQQTNEKVNTLRQSIAQKQQKLQTEEKWLQRYRQILFSQMIQQKSQLKKQQDIIESSRVFNDLVAMINGTIGEMQQRKLRVQQFFKKTKKPAMSIDVPQPMSKKVKMVPDGQRQEIEFLPENQEVIFNVWTFEGQIVQFILFFDPESKKLGLKNPSKTFHTADLNCVRAFNFHRSISQLYEELCLLVSIFIDDADDLPIYQGK